MFLSKGKGGLSQHGQHDFFTQKLDFFTQHYFFLQCSATFVAVIIMLFAKSLRYSILSTAVFLFYCYGFAQKNYHMESLVVGDGLSQGFVLSMFEDSRGFKWIGTFNGLNRYDGYQVKRFVADNSSPWSLTGQHIYAIREDQFGLLWLGTDKGVAILDPYSERFITLPDIDPRFPVNEVVALDIQAGLVWASDRPFDVNSRANIYAVKTQPDLVRLIRENKLSPKELNIQFVELPPGFSGPVTWCHASDSKATGVLFIDYQGYLGKIDPLTLKATAADLNSVDFPRFGPYGLLYYLNKSSGLVFKIPEKTGDKQKIYGLGEFVQPEGQMPLFFKIGDSILYQLDTNIDLQKKVDLRFDASFKVFFALDKTISYNSLVDKNNNLWFGTPGFGVRKLRPKKLIFNQYAPSNTPFNFNVLPNGLIWLGRDYPFIVFNRHTNKMEAAPWVQHFEVLPSKVYNLLFSRSGDWWLPISKNNRLFILRKNHLTNQWLEFPIDLPHLSTGSVPIFEDRNGNIWVSAFNGKIARIHPDNNQIAYWSFNEHFPKQHGSNLQSTCIVEDAKGTIWLGCNQGLIQIEHPEGTPEFKVWHNFSSKGVLFKNDKISSIYPDPDQTHLIWMGTFGGGLHCFDSQKESVEVFNDKNGLLDNVIYGILPDSFGYLWMSTNRGISRFNRQNKTFYNLSTDEKKLGVEFNTDAYRLLPGGDLAFGSVNGLFVIRPLPEEQKNPANIVAISEIKVNGIQLDPAIEATHLSFNSRNELSLNLPFDKNSIVFEFSALLSNSPTSATFRYRLLGMDEHWINAGSQRSANFALIPPGKYILEAQSVNASESWEGAPVTRIYVTILAPWYRSWYAYLLYAHIITLLIYAYIRYQRRYMLLKRKERNRQKEMERLKLIDEFKTRFFESVSHEFKTPLTIILGRAKQLLKEKNHSQIALNADAIIQQGQDMLEMVAQMIDVAKLGQHGITLNLEHGNVSNWIRFITESIRPLTSFKDIHLDFNGKVPDLMMDFDPLRLKFIVNNLLSNAIRHTPAGGQIEVSLDMDSDGKFLIEVSDTGEGIEAEDLPKIFDRYHQGAQTASNRVEQQFGIGLAFVKDLVNLFGGEISVVSQKNIGTCFKIILPINNQAPVFNKLSYSNGISGFTKNNSPTSAAQQDLPIVLVVEDNLYISNFIQECLNAYFHLEFAQNGAEGFSKALEIIPDIILTDVMIPGIDGYELTNRLKTHLLTSHIPIVMISALSDLSDRLNGQQYGANAYLGKPFDKEELLLTLNNLHHLQQRLRERYVSFEINSAQSALSENTAESKLLIPLETISMSDEFMEKLYAIFEENYKNEDFNHTQLCLRLEMSKSQLQRKLTAISAFSAMHLLRNYRLQKANEILSQNPGLSIKEICYMVGFKDASHFSRLFTKTFQLTPSAIKKDKNGEDISPD